MADVFWLTKFHPGIDLRAYEEFVRRVDYPRVGTYPSVLGYTVHRIKGTLSGDALPPYDCIEHFQVKDVPSYLADRERASGKEEFRRQLFSFLHIAIPLDTEPIR